MGSTTGETTITDSLITLNLAAGGTRERQGIGGGLYTTGGATTLAGKTKVVGNLASTSDNNIFDG